PLGMFFPGGDGVVLVEAGAALDELPEPLEIGLAEHLRRPARVRDADHAPVVQALVDLPRAPLGELEHPRLADAVAREVCEQIGLGVADESHDRGALVAERALPL